MSNTPTPTLAELKHLTFGYGQRVVLQDVNLSIARGKVTALMGTSGGGKTTVLRLISGQCRAQQGQTLFDGQDVGAMDRMQLDAARRRMGMLFQFGALFDDLSIFENVAFALRENRSLPESLIRDLVLMKLNAVGLRGARDLRPFEVSAGMARRAALARAIVLDPELILYDEPFSGLDPIAVGATARLIRELNDTLGVTSLVVSHELRETFEIADHVVIVANGGVAQQGSPLEVAKSTDPLVHQFVNALAQGPVQFHYPAPSVQVDYSGVAG